MRGVRWRPHRRWWSAPGRHPGARDVASCPGPRCQKYDQCPRTGLDQGECTVRLTDRDEPLREVAPNDTQGEDGVGEVVNDPGPTDNRPGASPRPAISAGHFSGSFQRVISKRDSH